MGVSVPMLNFSVDVLPWQRLAVAARHKAQLRADLNVAYRLRLSQIFDMATNMIAGNLKGLNLLKYNVHHLKRIYNLNP